MEAICSFETSVPTRTIQQHIQEDGILHSHQRENFKSYTGVIKHHEMAKLILKFCNCISIDFFQNNFSPLKLIIKAP
jgi:hypothetical protein